MPSQKMGYEISDPPDLERYSRLEERRRKRRRVDISVSSSCGGTSSADVNMCEEDGQTREVSCQTEPERTTTVDVACQTDMDFEEMRRTEQDHNQLQIKITLYEKVTLSEEALKNNEQKLKFYTGMLDIVFFTKIFTCRST